MVSKNRLVQGGLIRFEIHHPRVKAQLVAATAV